MDKKSTEPKAPKSVEVKVLVPWAIVTVLLTLAIGLIGGYFSTINLHAIARQQVTADIQQLKQ